LEKAGYIRPVLLNINGEMMSICREKQFGSNEKRIMEGETFVPNRPENDKLARFFRTLKWVSFQDGKEPFL